MRKLVLLTGLLAGLGLGIVLGCQVRRMPIISVCHLGDEAVKLIKPGDSILPLHIEQGAMGRKTLLPKIVMEIGETKIELTILENSSMIVTYETDIEKTGILEILSRYEPADFRDAYSINNNYLKDGDYTLIKSNSCYYSFYLSSLDELPETFVEFRPLLEEINNIIKKTKSYRVIKRVPFIR